MRWNQNGFVVARQIQATVTRPPVPIDVRGAVPESFKANAMIASRQGEAQMLPTIIHQYWDRPRPPDDVADRMATWPHRNVGWEHRLWDDASGTAFLEERFGSEAWSEFLACLTPPDGKPCRP